MHLQITVLEVNYEAYKSDPPTPSGLPRRFCACYYPFWKPENSYQKRYPLKAFGNTEEEATLGLKEQIREIMKRERIQDIKEVPLEL